MGTFVDIKLGILIPDRGDRPLFLKNCLRMLEAQTFKPTIIELINEPPKTNECDITYRYRTGYDKLRNKGLDVIALIENDDFYSPEFLETMVKEWDKRGRPQLLGTDYTIYYQIELGGYMIMHHIERSSAMSTLIKPDLEFNWCPDNEPYTDMHLWNAAGLNGAIFHPDKHICIGIKHNVGMCGGYAHNPKKLYRYTERDTNKDFLRANMDAESFDFYSNYFNLKSQI